jgi:hypothetical protein
MNNFGSIHGINSEKHLKSKFDKLDFIGNVIFILSQMWIS